MPKFIPLLIATCAMISFEWVTTKVAHAADGVCTGALGAQRFENLEVPAGANCTLNGTVVDGNITVGNNARLVAGAVTVGGNIQADGAVAVTVNNNAKVGGSVQLKDGGSASLPVADMNKATMVLTEKLIQAARAKAPPPGEGDEDEDDEFAALGEELGDDFDDVEVEAEEEEFEDDADGEGFDDSDEEDEDKRN